MFTLAMWFNLSAIDADINGSIDAAIILLLFISYVSFVDKKSHKTLKQI